MKQDIQVSCLINRVWDISVHDWTGETVSGTLIDISTQSDEEFPGKLIPVGIVLLNDGSFQSVPMDFIQTNN
ncbi:MAG: hypothetical protein LBI03_09205 [Clostridiales bacterium]|jgi:hypothetical protein|nr:hypothetical protein [Clostridiales bacterium]